MTAGTPFRERRFTAADGLSLYFRDYGDPTSARTPVLCLAGLIRNSKDFHDLASRLAVDRRVICLDYRGRGNSDRDPEWHNYRADVYVGDITELLTAANLHPVIVIGTSLGGLLAMALAVTRPTALAGVVLNDVGPDINGSGLARIIAYVTAHTPQPDWPSAAQALKQNYKNLSITTEEGWMKLARQTYREDADGALRYDVDPGVGRALAAASRSTPDLWPLFRALRRVPTLALRGDLSDVLSPQTFDRMAEEKDDLVRVTVAGVGHVPFLGEPECVSAIDEFLSAF